MTELAVLDAKRARLQALRPLDAARLRALDFALKPLETELIAASNQIEGNTLTVRETELVIAKGLTIGGKPLRDHLEAINHRAALDYVQEIAARREPLSQFNIKSVHQLILTRLNDEWAGRYRNVPVRIAGSRHVPPPFLQVAEQMDELERFLLSQEAALHPVHFAADAHEKLATIHPFVDGNGRTSRLLMNLVLLRGGFPLVSIPGDAAARLNYYDALEATQTGDEPGAFRAFIAARTGEALDRMLAIFEEFAGEAVSPQPGGR